MPALLCPRCQRPNPDSAVFCHFDGTELRSGQTSAGSGRLHQEFVFPSGKRCRSFDELAQACQEDWAGARDLLRKGAFVKYFSTVGRMDLARSAQESMENANADIGLSNLVSSMPLSRAQGPRLDLHPRRLVLGTMLAGEARQVPLVVTNQGQGLLQGTLTVAEGGEWLRIDGSNNGQCNLQTPKEQQVQLQVDTRGLAAGQPYGARLTVVTNGGIAELAARLDLAAHPFARAPLQGARTPREMAERMRSQPKAAVPLLETGEICRWFESNGWNYPVRGASAKGVAGVQQFFESMGLSRPPTVQLSQTDAFHACKPLEGAHGQIVLQTPAKKWVYASVESDAAWLKVLTPLISGPQQAQIGYEIDAEQAPRGKIAEGHLNVEANGGQKLVLRVLVEVEEQRASLARRVLQPILTCALAFFLLRLALVPIMDFYGRGAAASAALARITPQTPPEKGRSFAWGGWLELPWSRIYFGAKPDALDGVLPPATPAELERTREFRDYFTGYLLRLVMGLTWWIGAILGVVVLWRRGKVTDAPWGLIAGAAAGLVVAATVGSAVIGGDLALHWLWDATGMGSGLLQLALWAALAVAFWTGFGFLFGLALTLLGPFGKPLLYPFQVAVSEFCQLVGFRKLGDFFGPV